jgi:hypothetical protein
VNEAHNPTIAKADTFTCEATIDCVNQLFVVTCCSYVVGKAALTPKTIVGYRSLLDVVVLPRRGDVKLKDIDHAAIQAWVSWLTNDPAARQRPVKRVPK